MIIDIAIISIIVLAAIIGLITGFYKSMLGFVASLVAFIAAFFLAGLVTRAIFNIDAVASFFFGPFVFGNLRNIVPEVLTQSTGIIGSIMQPFAGNIISNQYVLSGAITNHDATVALLVYAIFSAIVASVLFAIMRLLLMIPVRILKKVRPRGRKGPLSRILGFVFGGIKGLMFAVAVMMLLSFAAPFVAPIANQFDNSHVAGPIANVTARHQRLMVAGDVDTVLDRILPFAINTIGDEDSSGYATAVD